MKRSEYHTRLTGLKMANDAMLNSGDVAAASEAAWRNSIIELLGVLDSDGFDREDKPADDGVKPAV